MFNILNLEHENDDKKSKLMKTIFCSNLSGKTLLLVIRDIQEIKLIQSNNLDIESVSESRNNIISSSRKRNRG
jgi:hypothetical protein